MTAKSKNRPLLIGIFSMLLACTGYAALAMVSSPASSTFYKIEGQIVVNEAHISSPTIVALAGEEAVVESGSPKEKIELKVVADESQQGPNEVALKMAFRYRDAQVSFETKNQIALPLNQWSELHLSDNGNPSVKLRLRVTEYSN